MLVMQFFARFARWWTPSATVQRQIAIATLIAQIVVALGGAIVRVTGSGLGCPTWPECAPGSVLPIADPHLGQLHQWIEFGNRLLGGAVGLVSGLMLLVALAARPYRRRYVLLALTMPLGVVAQAVIGGFTVLMKLEWWTVALHFIPSAVLVWCAVMLVHAVDEGDGPARAVVPRPLRGLLRVMTAVLAVLLASGTLVTGAGPHAGDPGTHRLDLPVASLVQFHADFLFLYLGMVVALGFALRVVAAPHTIWRRYWALIAVVALQGVLGMVQYRLGVPWVLVALHMLGAMLVIAASARLWAATREREDTVTPVPVPVPELAGKV